MTAPMAGPKLGARFTEALVYTTDLHSRQRRKGTDLPYIAHLLSVAALVIEDGGDEDEAIAALLHDAVEDQGGLPTLAVIRERFGERVAAIVLGCTDADSRAETTVAGAQRGIHRARRPRIAVSAARLARRQAAQRPCRRARSAADRRCGLPSLRGRQGGHHLVLPHSLPGLPCHELRTQCRRT